MVSPRLPIVQTQLEAGKLSILEEAFAAQKQAPASPPFKIAAIRVGMPWERDRLVAIGPSRRRASPRSLRRSPAADLSPSSIRSRRRRGGSVVVAVALCEGWHDQPGQRVMDINVEGAPTRTVDTVADLGKNVAGVFWFDAKDVNNDGLIDLSVTAAKNAKDKNTILNGFWVFDKPVKRDDAAVLSGSLDAAGALGQLCRPAGFRVRKDFIFVHVTNNGDSAADDPSRK